MKVRNLAIYTTEPTDNRYRIAEGDLQWLSDGRIRIDWVATNRYTNEVTPMVDFFFPTNLVNVSYEVVPNA